MNLVKSIILLLLFVATTSYAQMANKKCKFLGNVIGDYKPESFLKYWNQVTPENGGNWADVEATRDVMKWGHLDNAYKVAKDNKLRFTQHSLVWGLQQPSWIGSLSPEEQREELEEWIKAFGERYADADYIEVVNEPLHEIPVYAEAIGGAGATGWDWVIWVFEKARQYCPNSKLILNDYNIIRDDAAVDDYLAIINILKDRGLIDYIGEQGHYLEEVSGVTIARNLDKLWLTNIPILITAYDVNIVDDKGQRARIETQFPVLWQHEAVHGVTYWGIIQFETFQKSTYLIHYEGTVRIGLFWMQTFVKSDQGGMFCITGLNDEGEMEHAFLVYPNPAHGNFTVNTDSGFVVRDLLGRVLITGWGRTSLYLDPGLYIIQSDDRIEKLLIR